MIVRTPWGDYNNSQLFYMNARFRYLTCGTQSNLLQEISNTFVKNNDVIAFELHSWDPYEYPLRGQLIFITVYVTPPISYNTYRRG